MFYDLQGLNLPVKALKNNCTMKRIFYFDSDISLELEKKKPKKITMHCLANLVKYALKEKPLIGRLQERKVIQKVIEDIKTKNFKDNEGASEDGIEIAQMLKISIRKDNEGASEDGIEIAQILYGPNAEDIDPEAINNQLGFMRESLEVPTRKGVSLFSLKDSKLLKKQSIIYITGNSKFKLSVEEVHNLKVFLDSGGFMFADSGCSCEEFNKSFNDLMKKIYPKSKLELIPLSSPVYQEPFTHDMDFTSELKIEKNEEKPFLLGIRHNDRYLVIYSPLDFSSALANKLDDQSKGIKAPAAFRLVTNIISYGLSY